MTAVGRVAELSDASRSPASELRIAHVLPSVALRAGGVPVCVIECAAALADLGVRSRIFATDLPGPPSAKRQPGVTVEELPAAARSLEISLAPVQWPRRVAYAPRLATDLAAAAPWADLINIHSLFLYPQYAAWRAAERAGTPHVVTVHGALDPYLRQRGRLRKKLTDVLWQRRMLESAAALQFATNEEAELVADVAPAVPRIVVPLGVDTEAFRQLPSPGVFRDAWLGGHEGPVVLALGRLARKKGLDILVEAFARVHVHHPDAVLVVAGPDDEGIEPMLRSRARELGIGDRVHFPGMLLDQQRLEALAAATVWALPSHTENFAIAAMEALAAGVPTIVSPGVNLAPLLREHGAALVTEATPEAFAAALDELLSHPERRAQLAAAGREFADAYDWRVVAAQTVRAYEALLAGVGSDPAKRR